MIDRHKELAAHNPLPKLKRKSSVMAPAIDLSPVTEARSAHVERDGTALFVETRDAEIGVLNKALSILRERDENYRLITVGPVDGLAEAPTGRRDADGEWWTRRTLEEFDDDGHARGLCEAGVIVSVKADAPSDFLVVRGLAAGCRPVLPASGFYPELLSPALQKSCLYDLSPEPLAAKLQDALSPFQTASRPEELRKTLAPFDPASACKQMDERFEELVWVRPVD
jgi:hypothetical protein